MTTNTGTSDYNNKRNQQVEKHVLKDNSNSKNGKIFQPVGQANNSSTSLGPNHKRAKS